MRMEFLTLIRNSIHIPFLNYSFLNAPAGGTLICLINIATNFLVSSCRKKIGRLPFENQRALFFMHMQRRENSRQKLVSSSDIKRLYFALFSPVLITHTTSGLVDYHYDYMIPLRLRYLEDTIDYGHTIDYLMF